MPPNPLLMRALAVKRELADRQRDDPLNLWEPTPKQRPFIESVLEGEKNENWFIAANRSGKSDAGAYIGATLARFGDSRSSWVSGKDSGISVRDTSTSGWVIAVDFPSSRDVIQPKYFNNGFVTPDASHAPFIPDREVEEWRTGDQILKLKNGSIIGFKSGESGRSKFQGAEKSWIHFDEEPDKSVYTESVIRVGIKKMRVFGTCTILPPEGEKGGISWLFSEKVKPFIDGVSTGVEIFTASIYDNPFIPATELSRLESIYPDGSLDRRIRLNGELIPGVAGSRAYGNFDARLHVRRQPEIMPRRPLCWALDFNVEPQCSLLIQRDGPIFRVYKEIILESGGIDDVCQAFYETIPRHMAEVWVYGDATGRARGQTGKSDYTLILNGMRQYRMPFRLKVPEKNPAVTDRINAMNSTLRDPSGMIGIEIDPSCKELIADLEGVLKDARGGLKKVYQTKDPYSRRTHTSDCLGYYVSYENPVRAISHNKRPSDKKAIKDPHYHMIVSG